MPNSAKQLLTQERVEKISTWIGSAIGWGLLIGGGVIVTNVDSWPLALGVYLIVQGDKWLDGVAERKRGERRDA